MNYCPICGLKYVVQAGAAVVHNYPRPFTGMCPGSGKSVAELEIMDRQRIEAREATGWKGVQ